VPDAYLSHRIRRPISGALARLIILVMPGQTGLNLLQVDVPAVDQNLTKLAAIAVVVVVCNGNFLAEYRGT
jgi:hypothetical protein